MVCDSKRGERTLGLARDCARRNGAQCANEIGAGGGRTDKWMEARNWGAIEAKRLGGLSKIESPRPRGRQRPDSSRAVAELGTRMGRSHRGTGRIFIEMGRF